MENEKWLPVVGYEKYYEVSSFGRVRRIAGFIKTRRPDGQVLPVKETILSACDNGHGYLIVGLVVHDQRKSKKVHQLVANAFLKKEAHHQCVNHKNGVRHDNRVENLEWCTYYENLRHSYDVLGRDKMAGARFGADNYRSIAIICVNTGEEFSSIEEATGKLKLYMGGIARILQGKQKTVRGLSFIKKNQSPPSPNY